MPTLVDDLVAAIVADDAEAARLVSAVPEMAKAHIASERLLEEIPHQLYLGDTPVHVAAAALRPLTVAALIEAGADPNAANRRGAIALHYACDARPNLGRPRDTAVQTSVIELLLDAGSNIEHKDKSGAAPLHRAIRARSPRAVRCLLERGARVDSTHGRHRTTLLQLATLSTGAKGTKGALVEQQEIVELLLKAGCQSPPNRARSPRR